MQPYVFQNSKNLNSEKKCKKRENFWKFSILYSLQWIERTIEMN